MVGNYYRQSKIWLYCTVDKETIRRLQYNQKQNCVPLVLYETPEISRRMTPNVNNMTTLGVEVYIGYVKGQYYYDEFILDKMQLDNVIKILKMQGRPIKNVNDYKEICAYTRTLAKMEQSGTTLKRNVVQYCVNDPRILLNAKII